MSDSEKPRLTVPRPGALEPNVDEGSEPEFDTAALLVGVQDELDREAELDPVLQGHTDVRFEQERPLSETLGEHGRDGLRERAEWLEQEAAANSDPTAKARLLVLSSELYNAIGEREHAGELAERARTHDDDFAQRQSRQLNNPDRDFDRLRASLSEAVEGARTSDERAHAAFTLAELERLIGDSAAQSLRYFDIGQKQSPGDPRAALFKLSRQLGQSARSPSIRWPEGRELEPLRFATHMLARLRGERHKTGPDSPDEPLLVFVEAQQALQRGKAREAGQALSGLFLEAELGPPARWLAAALLAPDPETRDDAVAALSELLDINPTPHLRRTVAARSLEAGQFEAAQKALYEDESSEDAAFSDTERVAIGALTSASDEQLAPFTERVANDKKTRALAWALSSARGDHPAFPAADTPSTRARLELASLLSRQDYDLLEQRCPALLEDLPRDRFVQLLLLEFAHRRGRAAEVADGMVKLVHEQSGDENAVAHYAAGLLLERAREVTGALPHYEAALQSKVFAEAALRALEMLAPERAKASHLETLANNATRPSHKAALLEELALPLLDVDRDEATTRTAETALDALLEVQPDSPLAQLLTERRLTQRNEMFQLEESLIRRLAAESTGFEGAWLRARLLRLFGDHEQAPTWLNEALSVCPTDAALVALHRRTHKPDAVAVAKLHERLALGAKTPWSKARLLLEAALSYEEGGAYSDAARAARESDSLATSDLARQCFTRNALQCEHAVLIKERWVQESQTAPEPTRVALYLRLAELERNWDNVESEQQWLQEAQKLAPQRLDLLLELERIALRESQRHELLAIETRLTEALDANDSGPHALLAARRERVQKGWTAGYDALKKADHGEETSLYTLRQLQAHARRSADDEATRDLSLRLLERTEHASDKVILLLRAAEACLRLGQRHKAEALVEHAIEILPQHVLLHHFVANTGITEDARKRAEANEQIATHSRVAKHQAEAWYDAANLWIDQVGDKERGLFALQKAADLDPTHVLVFEKLFRALKDRGDVSALARFTDQRLQVITDKEERSELAMLQSQLLRESGQTEKSRAALQRILQERPDHLPALEKLAAFALEDADAKAAEQALLQLARLSSNWDDQANAYMALGNLYKNDIVNLERAERCYQEVLRRKPNHVDARGALLPLYLEHQQLDKAKKQFEETLASLPDEHEQQAAFLEYVGMVDQYLDDKTYKGELIDQALTMWPLDPEVLDLAVRLYHDQGEPERIAALDEQTFVEVTRKLSAGFLDPRYLRATAALCVPKGEVQRARLMQAMAAALTGQLLRLPPLLGQAMQRTLDEKLAPAPMISPLRTLLMMTREVLEHAFVATGPKPEVQRADAPLVRRVKTTASQAGVPAPTVCVDAAFPHACWLTGGKETQLILGERLCAEASSEELDFLIWRSLKLLQARAGVFTRLDAAQSKIATVAFLSCFVDVKLAPEWDVEELARVRARLTPLIPTDLDDDVPVLALDALQSLTKSGEHLALAARKWANRTALLATGNINAALSALIRLTGNALSTDPTERTRQLADNPETRDLVASALLPAMGEALAGRH